MMPDQFRKWLRQAYQCWWKKCREFFFPKFRTSYVLRFLSSVAYLLTIPRRILSILKCRLQSTKCDRFDCVFPSRDVQVKNTFWEKNIFKLRSNQNSFLTSFFYKTILFYTCVLCFGAVWSRHWLQDINKLRLYAGYYGTSVAQLGSIVVSDNREFTEICGRPSHRLYYCSPHHGASLKWIKKSTKLWDECLKSGPVRLWMIPIIDTCASAKLPLFLPLFIIYLSF